MSTKIDGKQIAAEIKTNLAERVNKLKAQGIQPGLGTLLVQGIRQKDIPCTMGATVFYAFLFCTCMLLVDLLYAFADPRIKAKYAR